MTPKRRSKRKSRFKRQNEIDMQPPSISKNHTDHEQDSQNIEGTLNNQRDVGSNQLHIDVQGMTPKRRTKRKSRFKLQAEIDMQPPHIGTNHTDHEHDGQNIEGTLNNHRDVVSNQLHVDVQDNVPLVENMSSVPDQNDDMNQEYNKEDWHKMPMDKKKDMLNVIKDKYDLPLGTENWTLCSIAKKWRNWKSELKRKYYDPELSIQILLQQRDERAQVEQYMRLVAFWNTRKSKVCILYI
ncbi:hypothetical protein ZIOFF_029573 [Zingiber officinale]|uniref:Uncharacterized protein n=1 Tax=Zingiber officinale TaxID=94328 RepID=A0A8J5GPR2_ZINOF|nr:hypothetical protein ZIOFF_029573 [Zingiber officinale]